jgi:hypothetical protein
MMIANLFCEIATEKNFQSHNPLIARGLLDHSIEARVEAQQDFFLKSSVVSALRVNLKTVMALGLAMPH